jgi:secondary thiamine-phosphate synthase enzyme
MMICWLIKTCFKTMAETEIKSTQLPLTMVQSKYDLIVPTRGREMVDITRQVQLWIRNIAAQDGVLTLFIRHTSASLTIQENADPDVQADLLDALDGLAPEHAPYRHTSEGRDDMPAHIKSAITSTSLNVPVDNGQLGLGMWQGIYVIEHRASSHQRQLSLHFIGELDAG